MHIIFNKFVIKENHLDNFLDTILEDAERSIQDEPNCHRFDVLQNVNKRNEIYLLEVYENEAAFRLHKQTPHFKKFDEAVKTKDWLAGNSESLLKVTVGTGTANNLTL